MTMSFAKFPEQQYVWRCGLCPFVAPRREEWDEAPGATFCPNDGSPLERVSCPHCGAPVMWRQTIDGRGNVTMTKARYCGYCGGKTAVRERRMRHGPKIAPKVRPDDIIQPKIRIEPPKVYGDDFKEEE